MKLRMTTALFLLAAYPLTAVVLSLLDANGHLTVSMQSVMTIRFLAGVASFCGIALLVGEYQAKKQVRRTETKNGQNKKVDPIN